MNSNAQFNVIAALDLDPIKVKLMHRESGEGWSLTQVNQVEFEYRRFLQLLKLYPEEQVTPRFDVDIFWHYHILDTMKYAVDCEQIFGYFLHHYPYSGLGGEEDAANHDNKGTRTQELYAATFGEPCLRHETAYAIAGSRGNVAQNDRSYSVRAAGTISWCDGVARPVAGTAKMAWCDGVARPAAAAANMAWCDGVAHPVAGAAKMAWCDGVARPVSGAGKLAWCDGVARPLSGAANMAWCDGVAQNDRSVQDPTSAIAA